MAGMAVNIHIWIGCCPYYPHVTTIVNPSVVLLQFCSTESHLLLKPTTILILKLPTFFGSCATILTALFEPLV